MYGGGLLRLRVKSKRGGENLLEAFDHRHVPLDASASYNAPQRCEMHLP